MWKKVISLFLVLCMLTSIVGCGSSGGGNFVTPEPVDNASVEEEGFNVIADEGGVFEFTDGSKVEIGENALNKDATLTISKLVIPPKKQSSSDFEVVSGVYDIKFNEQNIQILKPIKISLAIPTGIDVSDIAIAHFHEDDQYDILNGTISLDGKVISIEVTELSQFAIIDFSTSVDFEAFPFIDDIIDFYITAVIAGSKSDYDYLQAMTMIWEAKLKEAETAMIESTGITPEDVAKIGVMIYSGIGISFLVKSCMVFLMASGVPKALLVAMGFGVTTGHP